MLSVKYWLTLFWRLAKLTDPMSQFTGEGWRATTDPGRAD